MSADGIYVVQEGDTLMGVSMKVGVPVALLKRFNHLFGKNNIYVGQILKTEIPAATQTKRYSDENKPSVETSIVQSEQKNEDPFFQFKMLSRNKSIREKYPIEVDDNFPKLRKSPSFRANWIKDSEDLTSKSLNKFNSSYTSSPTMFSPLANKRSSFRYRANSDPSLDIQIDENYFPPQVAHTNEEQRPRSVSKDMTPLQIDFNDAKGIPMISNEPVVKTKLSRKINLGNYISDILSNEQMSCIASHLPQHLVYSDWHLRYSVFLHGADYNSFYHRTNNIDYTVIAVRTMDGQVFGGLATEPWKSQRSPKFYGTGESFLFRAVNDKDVDVYDWKCENYFFMWSNHEQVAMGGGGGHFGFVLNSDFRNGSTSPCLTYGNPFLTSHGAVPFKVENVEIWALKECPLMNITSQCGEGDVMFDTSREHKILMGDKKV